ncbi:MAG: glycosyltransferase family 2 protein [Gammaproteobacteria bacterium]|nr:glycosyltransferase family 2 protein [Gammaproteobacteria bacterium]
MLDGRSVGVVIPARNEQENIAAVVQAVRALRTPAGEAAVDDIVVCDNGSTDATAERALAAGARVVAEPTPGYGIACLTAIAALGSVEIVLFVDGDQAFHLEQSLDLLDAIVAGADLAIGSRALGRAEPGALSLPQIVGNRVAAGLIGLIWKQRVTDLGPLRAITTRALDALDMQDKAYGWTVEMQVKAVQRRMRIVEVPVDARRRQHGKSKVGGTVRGVVGASVGILGMILKLWLRPKLGAEARSCA